MLGIPKLIPHVELWFALSVGMQASAVVFGVESKSVDDDAVVLAGVAKRLVGIGAARNFAEIGGNHICKLLGPAVVL